MPQPSHAHELARSLMPQLCERDDFDEFLIWPPDLFALTSLLLAKSGAHTYVTNPHAGNLEAVHTRAANAVAIGQTWRSQLDDVDSFDVLADHPRTKPLSRGHVQQLLNNTPAEVKNAWGPFLQSWSGLNPNLVHTDGLQDLHDDKHAQDVGHLLFLHAVADAACEDVLTHTASKFLQTCKARLFRDGTLSFCDPSRVVVLPKQHTPQVGLSLRSISLNLAFHQRPAASQWLGNTDTDARRQLRLLLFPWPFVIRCGEFSPGQAIDKHHRFFCYAQNATADHEAFHRLNHIIAAAKKELGGDELIDMLIMPESSLDKSSHVYLHNTLKNTGIRSYVCGLRECKPDTLGANFLQIAVRTPWADEFAVQHKHHRWRLDGGQAYRYALGRSLSPDIVWWEGIAIPPRTVSFVDIGNGMVITPLICEDLARQDPVAPLVRAVGPSLVVALLMDGPQLRSRWSAYYATVLADDPGSSVLTLTSKGMVDRWRSPYDHWKRIVALWKDRDGPARELDLGDSDALLLNVDVVERGEWSADGRKAIRHELLLRESVNINAEM